jgi:hypothetical protein
MRIASNCRDRALLLLQIAQEWPQFKERATYLAHDWLVAAAIADELGLDQTVRKGDCMFDVYATLFD